jgi:hypothetical protein
MGILWFTLPNINTHEKGYGFLVIILLALSICIWGFIKQLQEYIRLRLKKYEERLFQDFVTRVMDGIKQREMENAIKDTEEKLENIGITIYKP